MSYMATILIVDDEPLVCDSLKGLLGGQDYEIHTANSGKEAIEYLSKVAFDLVLLDIVMPGIDGFEVMDLIARESPDTLVIIITGYTSTESAVEALRRGAYYYISKPVAREEFLVTIKNALEKKRLRDEKKIAEETLKENSEKIKLFAYSISHDLRSPAIGIYGLTKLLHKKNKDILDEKGKNYCNQIMKAAEQIVAFVEKINDYISTKEATLIIEKVNLREIIQMLREEVSTQLDIRQIKWSEPEFLPEIEADKLAILRTLRNLVDNALKYGGPDLSQIKIKYKESDEFHIISLNDDGIGIKEEDSKKIFGLFERYETARGTEGAGLGLAIVKEVAEQHRGEVWVEPGQGKGITFYVSISKYMQPSR